MKTGLESLETGAPKITYSGNEGPKPPQQMAMADPLLVEEYQKYVFEMEEQGLTPMSFEEFKLQAMSGMAEGGVAQLVKKNEDGSRPGYRGLGGYGGGPGGSGGVGGLGEGSAGGGGGGGDGGDRREQYSVATTQGISPTIQSALGIERPDRNPKQKEFDRLNRIAVIENLIDRPNILNPSNLLKGLTTIATGLPINFLNKIRDIKITPTDDDDTIPRGDGENILPIVNMANIAGPTTPTVTNLDTTEDETKDFVNRFAPVKNLPFADYKGGIEVAAADGGRIGYAGGGITGLRQGYFLGKLVRKATKAVKKVVKSPIGKAALAFGAYNYGPQLLSGKGLKLGDITKFRNLTMKNINPMRFIGLTSLLPFLMPQEQEEENLDAVAASRAGDVNPFDQYGGVTGLRRKVLAGNLDPAEFPFMNPTYYAADGGRIGFANGGNDDEDETVRSQALGALYSTERPKFSKGGAGLPPITTGIEGQVSQSFPDDETPAPTQQDQMPRPMPNPMMMAGRMNPMMARQMNPMMRGMNPMMSMQPRMMAQDGGIMMASYDYNDAMIESFEAYQKAIKDGIIPSTMEFDEYLELMQGKKETAPRVMAQEGGLMDMGGMEKDYRNEGGFVPIGAKERADDVPARLSKNEFVFTAEAVRNAGGGDIDKGAEIMENMMENLEQGGKVSEESQGLKGARAMFATQQRLGEVL
jgi:hypothetical protein